LDDATGRPLNYALVRIVRSDRDAFIENDRMEKARGLLAKDGARFLFGDLPPGHYLLRGQFVGYLSETMRLRVAAGDTTEAVLRLKPDARFQNLTR
jgi:hypothetical protein